MRIFPFLSNETRAASPHSLQINFLIIMYTISHSFAFCQRVGRASASTFPRFAHATAMLAFLGLLCELTPAFGQTVSFTNPSAIAIPDSGAATAYPSAINVSGTAGTISQVVVRLNGYTHTYPDDVDILLVSPTGQKVVILSDAGGGNDVNNVSLTLSDGAAAALPDSAQIVSGTFKPTNFGTTDAFPAQAPSGPYGTTFSAFNGLSANGVWSLFVVDDAAVDQGSISGGWTLTITTAGGAPAAPTISDIGNQATTMNTATAAIPFTVNDADTPAASLAMSGSSSNPTLVPNGNIAFGGSGANRTVTVSPAPNQSGTATITVTVSDGQLSANDSIVLTVNAVNDPPTISNIADQSVVAGAAIGPIGFTVGDVE